MKSQLDLHVAVLIDQEKLLGYSALRDVATMTSRVEHEGESFLTLALPTLGQALERGLAESRFDLKWAPAFAVKSKDDRRPRFLHDLFSKVFNSAGYLVENPSIDAVRALRQICYLHSKLKELPTPDKVDAAYAQYIATDQAISSYEIPLGLRKEFQETSLKIWGKYFAAMEAYLFRDGFLASAKHGPGAVAQKLLSNQKWTSREWTERLHSEFPAPAYLSHSLSEEGEDMVLHPPGSEPPARVIAVPKTAKGPRIITAEPVYNQFIQQGLASLFEEWMNFHPSVSYKYQEPNQLLAKASSVDGSHATIDLSEASDRVSLRVVKDLFRYNPILLSAVLSCRSMRSELPDGTIVQLRKFASMGSALTFPIETLVFSTIVVMAMKRSTRPDNVSRKTSYRVYGDDIIIPSYAANECVRLLEAFGLKVNVHKSFLEGNFRESCGGDYFHGSPVSPVRVRKRLPHNRSSVDELVAIVAFRNLYWKQYGPTEVVTMLDSFIEGIIPFPTGYPTTDALVRWDFTVEPEGFDKRYHRPLVRAVRPVYKYRYDPLDGESALLKFFWTPFNEDPKHLQQAGRPISAKLRYGKVLL